MLARILFSGFRCRAAIIFDSCSLSSGVAFAKETRIRRRRRKKNELHENFQANHNLKENEHLTHVLIHSQGSFVHIFIIHYICCEIKRLFLHFSSFFWLHPKRILKIKINDVRRSIVSRSIFFFFFHIALIKNVTVSSVQKFFSIYFYCHKHSQNVWQPQTLQVQ